MVAFIVLFLPAVLCLWIWEAISKTQLSKKKWIYMLSLNVLAVNLICFAVKRWVLDTADFPISSLQADMTPSAALHYLIIAIPAAVAVALLENFCFKKVRLRVESDEKNDTDEAQEN